MVGVLHRLPRERTCWRAKLHLSSEESVCSALAEFHLVPFIQSIIQQNGLRMYYVPIIVLETEDTAVNKTDMVLLS